jgi:hypothetical protein
MPPVAQAATGANDSSEEKKSAAVPLGDGTTAHALTEPEPGVPAVSASPGNTTGSLAATREELMVGGPRPRADLEKSVVTGPDEVLRKGDAAFEHAVRPDPKPAAEPREKEDSRPQTSLPANPAEDSLSAAWGNREAVALGKARRLTSRVLRPADDSQGVNGTPVAQAENQMNRAANKNEFASSGKQDLPGPAARAPLARDEAEPRIGSAGHLRPNRETTSPSWSGMPFDVERVSGSGETTSGEPASRRAEPERLLQMIQTEAQLISRTKAERLSVRLRPDAETEIFLRLSVQGGCVEVHARCDRGNLEALNAQWGQLQEALSVCGVRLAPLNSPVHSEPSLPVGSTGSFDLGESFQNERQPRPTPELPEREMDGPPSRRRSAAQPSARPIGGHLLELWA